MELCIIQCLVYCQDPGSTLYPPLPTASLQVGRNVGEMKIKVNPSISLWRSQIGTNLRPDQGKVVGWL